MMKWKFYKGDNMKENIMDIILENEWLIYKIINKYHGYFELDDLYQVAVIGLMAAYKNYNPIHNTKFTTYAYPYVLGEVIKYINEFRSIKINKRTQILYSKILKTSELLSQKFMRVPTANELAVFLEVDEKVIEDVINANSNVNSLDKVIMEDGKQLELYDVFGYVDENIENYPLTYEIDKLSPDEKNIIKARYFNDMSQKEVGELFGMYQVEVSRKEKKILKKLRDGIKT